MAKQVTATEAKAKILGLLDEAAAGEEIEITKDQVQDTQRVTDTVRREDVRVTDDSGNVVADDDKNRR